MEESRSLHQRMTAAVGGLAASATLLAYSFPASAGSLSLNPQFYSTFMPEAADEPSAFLVVREENCGSVVLHKQAKRNSSRRSSKRSKGSGHKNRRTESKKLTFNKFMRLKNPSASMTKKFTKKAVRREKFYTKMYNKQSTKKGIFKVLDTVFSVSSQCRTAAGRARVKAKNKLSLAIPALDFNSQNSQALVTKVFRLYRNGKKLRPKKKSKHSKRICRKHSWASFSAFVEFKKTLLFRSVNQYLVRIGWEPVGLGAPIVQHHAQTVAGGVQPAAAPPPTPVAPAPQPQPVSQPATPVQPLQPASVSQPGLPIASQPKPAVSFGHPIHPVPEPRPGARPRVSEPARDPLPQHGDYKSSSPVVGVVSPAGFESISLLDREKWGAVAIQAGIQVSEGVVDEGDGMYTSSGSVDDFLKTQTDAAKWCVVTTSADQSEFENLVAANKEKPLYTEHRKNSAFGFQEDNKPAQVYAFECGSDPSYVFNIVQQLALKKDAGFTGVVFQDLLQPSRHFFPYYSAYLAKFHPTDLNRPVVVYCDADEDARERAVTAFQMPATEPHAAEPEAWKAQIDEIKQSKKPTS